MKAIVKFKIVLMRKMRALLYFLRKLSLRYVNEGEDDGAFLCLQK